MSEINVEALKKAQRKASLNAIKLNKALGLSYLTVKNGMLVQNGKDGEKVIGKPLYGTKKADKRTFTILDEE
jgi:hypothetical protein